jgi:glycerol-3-phosphate dehydrogenase
MTGIPQRLPLSSGDRESRLDRLKSEEFDLLVVGGGVNGAGIARDAAMRGLRVALVEKGDFASGTSSKSSKLIHGGIRYLEHGEFHLVHVACRERDLLRRRLAPHLVKPLAFVFPVYRGDPVGIITLGIGMWLYDVLAAFRNIERHRMLSRARTVSLEPALRSEGLRGAALYYDCFTDDARLTLETILAAKEEGAVVANYVELRSFLKDGGRLAGAMLADRVEGTAIRVRARCVVNATGPWTDHIRRLDDPACKPCLRVTKGVHIIVPRNRVGNHRAVVMHSPRDKRVLFVIPWGAHDLIGTTDTDFHGSPDDVSADRDDIDYLIDSANWFFPRANLGIADVISTYAGLRPLVAAGEGESPSAVSREEEIFESPAGLITLVGGKLTTYRSIAREINHLVAKKLGIPKARRKSDYTRAKPLPGGWSEDPNRIVDDLVASSDLTREQLMHLAQRYGSRTPEVLALAGTEEEFKRGLVAGMPDIWAEAAFAVQKEMAVRSEDILFRRTHLALKEPRESFQVAEKIKEKLNLADDQR